VKAASRIRHFFRKVFQPNFWVCRYVIVSDNGRRKEGGSFAAPGATRAEAEADAITYIEEHAFVSGEAQYIVRRPNLWERMRAL